MAKRDVSFSLLLALALALTLGLKVQAASVDREPDSAALTRAIAATLARQGFATRIEPNPNQSSVVEAVRAACQMRVRDAALAGEWDKAFAADAGGLGPVRYYHRGNWYDAPPLWRMAAERYRARLSARLGFSGTFPAVLAVASRGCEHAMPDFSTLSQSWRTARAATPQG